MQALALRLQLRLWRACGRGFGHLEAALLDGAAHGSRPGRALRLARAACLRDVCAADPDRGVRLVRGLQVGAQYVSLWGTQTTVTGPFWHT